MTDKPKPEPLGAVERFKQLWDAYWEIKCCKHCDDKESHSVCDSCSIEFFSKGIREAEDALRKPLECGHPRACWVDVEEATGMPAEPEPDFCSACERQAQAVKEAVEEEREKNCRAMCKHCREGFKIEKIGREDYIHWIDNDDTAKYLTNSYSVLCHANNIRRRGEETISEKEKA